ncbi:hypothetical protein ABW16_03810 [Mycolicibacter heraklionensis]|uniref:Integral membrane protein n=1 Tax=Mycolicibacter heraklionensis TaxID=512402 RepID=A0ABR5FIW9_9MYCO|nr:hypothetical protein [Mycolicibacter heraklionensis]KLO30850.1 hypothetical protein ABW16_03810 [Mycolicibacter heraklionensis]
MPDLCTPTFERLAESLGFSCGEAGGLLEFRSPLQLENWTLPVLEITVITGAVLALIYAIIRYRRGDATNLALWFGAIAYLLIIEPPLYFPGAFGIADHVDTMFAHNVFSVEFLWGRLPLYIVAIYPMMATISFEIVRILGVFRRYGAIVGAICVGFVHHAFYEIFDHLGPQLRWWEWSVDNPLNQPMFTSVPLGSVVVFAALWPASLAFCVQLLVGRQADHGRRFTGLQVIWRTIVIGILASLGTGILPLPATLLGAATDGKLLGIAYAAELLIITAVAIPVLVISWRRLRLNLFVEGRYDNRLMVRYAAVYLSVMTVLWLTALPAYLDASGGLTANGDPVGCLWYVVLCFTAAYLSVVAAATVPPILEPRENPAPVAAGH